MSSSSSSVDNLSLFEVLGIFIKNYRRNTPTKLKLCDLFVVYQITTAVIQFVYCSIVGTFPFNAFLAGFISCIGSFVLTVSLRKQVNPDTKDQFKEIFAERAYSDFVISSLLLYFTCVAFMG